MTREVTLAAVQLPAWHEATEPVDRVRENKARILDMLAEAGRQGADLALVGECSNVMGVPWWKDGSLEQFAEPVPGPFTEAVAAVARRHGMHVVLPIIGCCEHVLRNTALVFDRSGSLIGRYDKVHPTLSEMEPGIVPGDSIPVFEVDFGCVGVMICMDIEYPEQALIMMLQGADVICFPHVQSGWSEIDWEVRYRARAIDTGSYLLSACYGERDGDWMPGHMIGRSGVVGPDGIVLAELGRRPGVLTRRVDLDDRRRTNFFFASSKHPRADGIMANRRPELYRLLCDPGAGTPARERVNAERQAAGLAPFQWEERRRP